MDEVLRRRLVGATVLLALAFLLASLLPDPAVDGEPRRGRVVTYDLATGKPLEPPAAEAPAVEPAAEPAPPATRPALKVDETLSEGAGQWFVQIGSFESQANARNALQKLYGLGLPTTIQSVAVGKNIWYRVRVGPYPDEATTERTLAAIRKQGYPLAKLVRPESTTPK